ncbi:hypothetical protein GQ602_005271 [Ophiocordyceps camponoti-floridani]|uniref:Uncharacterized protein n=1 Tax=Ophiocordyceps camponoti-floridani TaxID=2030778 RepID=A0A8H4Q5F4_9HYPO|nr:hypothetical protein GQ602_005271 [Ophiocordyceps camponoti-floridani]
MSRSGASMSANCGSAPQTGAGASSVTVTPGERTRLMTDSLARWLREPEARVVVLGAQGWSAEASRK